MTQRPFVNVNDIELTPQTPQKNPRLASRLASCPSRHRSVRPSSAAG